MIGFLGVTLLSLKNTFSTANDDFRQNDVTAWVVTK